MNGIGSPPHYTRTIVVSGDADSRLLCEGFAAGVSDYFGKSRGYAAFAEFIKDFTRRNSGLVGGILYVEGSGRVATLLTGLRERHGLQVVHRAQAEQLLANRANNPVTAALADIHHCWKINDNLGHIAGNRVLRGAGRTAA